MEETDSINFDGSTLTSGGTISNRPAQDRQVRNWVHMCNSTRGLESATACAGDGGVRPGRLADPLEELGGAACGVAHPAYYSIV